METLRKAFACASFTLVSASLIGQAGQTPSWKQALASELRFSSSPSAGTERPSGDVVTLEPFEVTARRGIDQDKLFRDLSSALDPERLKLKVSGDKISIVPDLDAPPVGRNSDGNVVFGGKRAYLAAKDIFEFDLPGGGVLKAQFRSGVSFKLDNGWKLILKPSRSKLLRLSKDF